MAWKRISGVKASLGGPAISHVMYTDDIVLFSKASRKEATFLVECLEKYCNQSGQSLNRGKSGVFFSKHTQSQARREIKHALQMRKLNKDAVYLSAPMFLSRAPFKDFKYIQERLESKLMGWRSKCLSWVGQCTLIDSVAQTIPNYIMSSFKIPSKICDNLNATIRRFWWKPKEVDGKFLACKAWYKLCLPKSKGGLGFKKAKDTNNILLAKLAWLVASKRDSLRMEILRSKYKVRQDWLHKPPPKSTSPIWRAIEGAKSIIVKGACYLMGDGASVDIWQDP